MKKFEITLKNEKLKQYERIASVFILINLAIFIFMAISAETRATRIPAIGSSVLIILALAIDYFLFSIKNNEGSPYKLAAEYVITMAWSQTDYWWIAIPCFILGLLYQSTKRPLLVSVLQEKIVYPSFPKKNISWLELNSMILKDGLLTINFKNDKFIQQFIDETKTVVNEQDFNDFCSQQLNK